MADSIQQAPGEPGLVQQYKDIGVDSQGNTIHAKVLALEPGSIGGGGAGTTQYAEGATNATPTGTVVLWRDGSNVLHAPNPSNGMPVNVVAGSVSVSNFPATQTVAGTVTANAGSGTFTVGGTVTANVGTTNGLALDATLTGGTQKTKLVDSGGTNVASVSAGGALKVDGTGGTFPVTGTFWQTTQPVSGTVTANAGSGTFTVGGTVSVNALPAGTNVIGDVNLTAAARGGYSVSSQTALTNTAGGVQITTAAGKFGGFMFINLNSAPVYIQVFDANSAITLGTTAPTFVIPIPAAGTPANGAAAVHEFAVGIALANGLRIAATTTPTGSTAPGTALTGFVLYK